MNRIRLLRSRRIGPATYARLMRAHGSAGAALEALPAIAAEAGVRGYVPCPPGVAEAELKEGRRLKARPIFSDDPEWPAALSEITDAPPMLWARGDHGLLARPAVALVGARQASSLGLRMARSLALGLAKDGYVVASGLARGIDQAAHEGALDGGTLAVLAGGVGATHSALDPALFERIAERGLLLSEHPPGRAPAARDFARRNRIVSGLSCAVVVVEAAARSGSMITARLALDQGREVLAVPGHPFDPRAAGCNMLIRDGAHLVRGPADVTQAVGRADEAALPLWSASPSPTPARRAAEGAGGTEGKSSPIRRVGSEAGKCSVGEAHEASGTVAVSRMGRSATTCAAPGSDRGEPASLRPAPDGTPDRTRADPVAAAILARLAEAPADEDQLIGAAGVGPARLAPALLALELDGRIERRPGGRIHAV